MNRYTSSFIFNEHSYYYCDLKKVFERYPILRKLPNSLKIILESTIRNVQEQDISTSIATFVHKNHLKEINFYPSRVIMQDFSGIPALVDLASMRDEVFNKGGNVQSVNPQIMVDLIIEDTSHIISERNKERYGFIKWAQNQFENFSVIPPCQGISHQVNLEYLSTMLSFKIEDNKLHLFPESIIGTDSHTTMINALGVLGYKTGGLETQAAILGSSISFNLPLVVGIEIIGTLPQGVSIKDAVFNFANILKENKVKSKFVEFYGQGLKNITIEDRASISSIVTEYGAINGYFGVDDNTIEYVEQTRGVDATLIKEYFIKQGMYDNHDLIYDECLIFDLSAIKPVIAGPKKSEDIIFVKDVTRKLSSFKKGNFVKDNDIVLAIITSCTSTSLIQAGLLAKRASELGLIINKNIKCIFKPDSPVVKEYLERLDLLKYLHNLGFYIEDRDFGIDNLVERASLDIERFNLDLASVTSESKRFEERIHPLIKSNWQMSPALVIAYCLKGNMNFDITSDAIFQDIYLSDIWPSVNQVNEYLSKIDYSMYQKVYKDIFLGNIQWQELEYENTKTYNWHENYTYIQKSKFFEKSNLENIDIENAKILALLDDNVTTEHISPSGKILPYTPAALYLESKGIRPDEYDTFGSRKGNAEVMARGMFSNIRLKNKIVSPKEGGFTKDFIDSEIMPIYDFSVKMQNQNTPLVIFAGNEYGIGDSRDWAAKGLRLLGVKAVIAKSFERIHKSNLVSMGILPLEFMDDDNINNLYLTGDEIISIKTTDIKPNTKIDLQIKKGYEIKTISVLSRLDTKAEVKYYKNGGILSYLLNSRI